MYHLHRALLGAPRPGPGLPGLQRADHDDAERQPRHRSHPLLYHGRCGQCHPSAAVHGAHQLWHHCRGTQWRAGQFEQTERKNPGQRSRPLHGSVATLLITYSAYGPMVPPGSDSELITQALSMEPPEQFKQDYLNRKFKNISAPVSNGHGDRDLEDSLNHSSPYATQLSQKEANFVARILHVCRVLCVPALTANLSTNLFQLMSLTPLSYSLVIMYDECIYAVRDPFGNRPLCIGALGK